LAALEATLRLYLDPARALAEIPALAMLTASVDSLQIRAQSLSEQLTMAGIAAEVVRSEASVGGGAFPTAKIESRAVALAGSPDRWENALRRATPPVIGHIEADRLLLDVRSVLPAEDPALATAVIRALA
jgi:L-seryl-tRNA(Ser) seleniumtransferase